MENSRQVAVFGGGCFWCVEAVFMEIKGVTSIASGYSGGHVENPSYYEVCGETTGHAEAVRLEFDPGQITFPEMLEIFFATHDPTTLNRQGADQGARYRFTPVTNNESRRRRTSRNWTQPAICLGRWSLRSPSSKSSMRLNKSTASSTRTTLGACTAKWSSAPRSPRSARSSPRSCGS